MIKLKDILKELQVKPQGITPEKVYNYYINNINNNNIFDDDNPGWKEYKKICKPYCGKYGILWFLSSLNEFEKLSQQDLNKLYQEMRTLVRKHVDKEILSELQVTPQNITLEKVKKYFNDNIIINNNEFHGDSDGWKEYEKLCEPYWRKYGITFLHKLSQPELNKFYKDMRTLVRKHVSKEILNELQVTPQNQNITAQELFKYYKNNIWSNSKEFKFNSPNWKEYEKLCKPYIETYDYAFLYKLSQQELNQFYNKMRTLVRKRVGKEIL